MLSFWEENSFMTYDIILVGGGIVGLSTAAALLETNPSLRVLVLERGLLPSGASTKNAGFACFGSVSELWQDLDQLGEKRMLELVRMRWEGLQMLRVRLGEAAMGYINLGGYELFRESELGYLDKIPLVNQALHSIFSQDVFRQVDEKIHHFSFASRHIKSLVENPFEAQIDTGEMMKSLWAYVNKLGAKVLTGAKVVGWDKTHEEVHVYVENPLGATPFEFKAEKLALCSNAFSTTFLPDLDLKPGRGQVLVTSPIPDLSFQGVFHMDEGYYYFRNYGNRVLFGGGRNLDFEGEQTHEMQTTPQIMGALEKLLKEVVLPNTPFQIEKKWAGIMAFGSTKEPICQQVEDRLFVAIRLGGMGIAIGSGLGKTLAQKLMA